MDSEYLKRHVGAALSLGLSEVCQKKPADPIDYLANWLRKFVQNEENKRQVIIAFTLKHHSGWYQFKVEKIYRHKTVSRGKVKSLE